MDFAPPNVHGDAFEGVDAAERLVDLNGLKEGLRFSWRMAGGGEPGACVHQRTIVSDEANRPGL